MPEHLIRLRGPWEVRPLGRPPVAPSRLSLPIPMLPASDEPRILIRPFGRPVRWEGDLPTLLRLDEIPGVVAVALNGRILAERPADAGGPIALPIGPLLGVRNLLELTVAPGPERAGGGGRPWGSVSLIFGRAEGPTVDG